ncbi:MAG: metallophosphoesterase [Acetobacteraceae bacterium]
MRSHCKYLRTIHPFLPAGFDFIDAITKRGIRVIGDVHSHIQSFIHAASTDRFIIQLGDLVDYGPDSEVTLHLMLQIMREGRGIFILGNHDRKLARVLSGRRPHIDSQLKKTLQQIAAGPHLLKQDVLAAAR